MVLPVGNYRFIVRSKVGLQAALLHTKALEMAGAKILVGLLQNLAAAGLNQSCRRAFGHNKQCPARLVAAYGERLTDSGQTLSGDVRPIAFQHLDPAPEFFTQGFKHARDSTSGLRGGAVLRSSAMVLQITADLAADFIQIRFVAWHIVGHAPTIAKKSGGVQHHLMKSLQEIKKMRRVLLDWYAQSGRTLPWRIRPPDRQAGVVADPYKVWLSEIMCQQTTTTAVIPYYENFLGLWPNVTALAEAAREDVLRAWAGLGYYARARNLHACARIVSREMDGRFPDTEAGLLHLPGIGPYTAAAIAAICYNEATNVVDGNVERVISRIFRVQTPLPKARAELRRLAGGLADPGQPGDYAQALMDLGALVCRPKNPQCPKCPWQVHCQAATSGDMTDYPRRGRRTARPVRYGAVFYVEDAGQIWLRQRAENGLLGGMLELPGTDWTQDRPDESVWLSQAPCPGNWQKLEGEIKHVFTHFTLYLTVYRGVGLAGEFDMAVHMEDIASQALPSLMRKAINHVHGL